MKIVCIGRNYSEHVKELGNEMAGDPVVFLKPDTALIKENKPFYLPSFSKDVHHEIELVLKISKEGKNILPEFAHKYVEEVSVGIDFTARDLQQEIKKAGKPWEICKSFDGSSPVGKFIPGSILKKDGFDFQLLVNGKKVQDGNTGEMIFGFQKIISYVSAFFTLRKGDLIFTGTPAGVGPVHKGDVLEGYLEGTLLLKTTVA